MVVFCKVSADLAFKSWKASQTSAATKDRFWRELTKACKEITGAELYKPATLDKYVRDETSISDDDAKIIMKAAKVLGVEFRLKNLRPTRQVADRELLNLTVTAAKRDLPKGASAPNFIEPDAVHELELNAKVDHGSRRIVFGTDKNKPGLYTAQVKVTQGTIDLQTAKVGIKRTKEADQNDRNAIVRGSGDPRDLQSYSWVIDDIPVKNGSHDVALGNWHGHFSTQDVAIFSAAREHILPSDFRHKFTGQLTIEELKTELTPEMAEAIDARIAEVLSGALREQTPERIELVSVPIFPASEDEV